MCFRKGKKRGLLFAAAMLVCGMAFPQSYPEEFSGAMFGSDTGTIPVSMCMTVAENLPYSVPDPPPCDGSFFWYGTLEGSPSVTNLDLDVFVVHNRVIGSANAAWHDRDFMWNPDLQAYARFTVNPEIPWVVNFEVITVDWSFEYGTYREGVFIFSGHPPIWWIVSEDFPYFEYELTPHFQLEAFLYAD